MTEATQRGITGIGTVAVPVTDQDRAVEFYVERLGFDKHMDAPVEQLGGRWITVAPPGSTTTIALIPASEGVPAGGRPASASPPGTPPPCTRTFAGMRSRSVSCCSGRASRRCSRCVIRTAMAW